MFHQINFAELGYSHKKRLIRKEVFLNEMEPTVQQVKLIALPDFRHLLEEQKPAEKTSALRSAHETTSASFIFKS